MKTRFEVDYRCNGVVVDASHEVSFHVSSAPLSRDPSDQSAAQVPAPFDVTIRLEPLPLDRQPGHRHGRLFLTLPGEPNQAELLLESVLPCVEEHIRFFYSDFRLLGGSTAGERIPETEEETQLIGDRPYWLRLDFEEVPDPVPFNSNVLRLIPQFSAVRPLIEQFNSARAARNPIDRYLGMFKILEFQFHTGRDPKKSLRNSKDFLSLAYQVVEIESNGRKRSIQQNEVLDLIQELVNTRDQCAHLQKQFGYRPRQREVYKEVRHLAGLVEKLAHESILQRFRAKAPNLIDSVLRTLQPTKSPPSQGAGERASSIDLKGRTDVGN